MKFKRFLEKWAVYIVALIVLIIFSLLFREGHNWGGDFSQYIMQARALVDKSFLQDLIDFNYRYYPWGFPLLLSPVYYFFGLNLLAMKIFVNLFFVASLFVIYRIFKNKINIFLISFILLVFSFNLFTLDFKDQILSDTPFLFFSLLSLFLIDLTVVRKKVFINRWVDYLLLGFMAFMSFFIRTQGITVLVVLLVCQLYVHYKSGSKLFPLKKSKLINYLSLIFFLLFFLLSRYLFLKNEGYNYFIEFFNNFSFHSIISNIVYYFKLLPEFFNTSGAFHVLFWAFFIISLVGVYKRRKKDFVYLLYFSLTGGLLLIWPGQQGYRFIMFFYPFFLFYLFVALQRINFYYKYVLVYVIVFVFMANSFLALSFFSAPFVLNKYSEYKVISGPYKEYNLKLIDYIEKNTNKDDLMVFSKPRTLSLYTGRKSIYIKDFNSNQSFDYIVLIDYYKGQTQELEDYIYNNSNDFDLVFSNQNSRVFKIKK